MRWAVVLALLLVACDGATATDAGTDASPGPTDAGPPRPPDSVGPADRPARLYAPPAHDGVTTLPLVLLLHGHGVNAQAQDLYLGLTRYARRGGFYVLLPDGTPDDGGEPHWDVLGAAPDDHAYLRGLLERRG